MSRIDRIYSEKRDYIRMQMEAAVTLHHDDQVTPARCLDLSSTGMQVEAISNLAMGQQVKVHMASDHEKIADLIAQTEVVRVIDLGEGKQSLGLTILSMS
jgi:c-di-GMP-binding flagellar brake protein YcgR